MSKARVINADRATQQKEKILKPKKKKIIELTNSTEKFNTGRRKDYWQTIYYVSDIR